MDRDTKPAILSLPKAPRESMKITCETRISSLWIARPIGESPRSGPPGDLGMQLDRPLSELTSAENKPAYLLAAGIQVLRNNFAR
jgi:hypothetical protein